MKDFNDLEYKIGAVDLNFDNYEMGNDDKKRYAEYGLGKFIVVLEGENTLAIYVGHKCAHIDIAKHFGLMPYPYGGHYPLEKKTNPNEVGNIVGGGSSIIREGSLMLEERSGSFGAVPKEVAEKFLNILSLELKKEGVNITQTLAEPDCSGGHEEMNMFWKQFEGKQL